MTIDRLRELHSARPFQPFRIHIAGDRFIDVQHPEVMAIFPGGRTVFIAKRESFEIVDLLLVSSLEVTNGKSQRTRRKPPRDGNGPAE